MVFACPLWSLALPYKLVCAESNLPGATAIAFGAGLGKLAEANTRPPPGV